MIRVYFDWNVFSTLKQNREKAEPYITIDSIISNNREKLCFPYSSAHINDLKRSYTKSERAKKHTLEDLEYLGQLSLGNALYEDHSKKRAFPGIRDPLDYFKEDIEDTSLENFDIDEIFTSIEDPVLAAQGKKLLDQMKSIPSGVDILKIKDLPEQYIKLKDLFENGEMEDTFYNYFKIVSKVVTNPGEYSDLYKNARNYSIEQMKLESDTTTWGNPFEYLEQALPKLGIQQNLGEFVKSSLETLQLGDTPTRFETFSYYYMLLDAFGYNRDGRLPNLVDDSMHAYYGAYCDLFVTNDKRTYLKTKAVYDQLNIGTIVCNAEEFPEQFFNQNYIGSGKEKNILDLTTDIISNSLIVLNSIDDKLNPSHIYKIERPVINYFNRLQLTEYEKHIGIYLYKRKWDLHSDFLFWTELETITNRIAKQFGLDDNNRKIFTETDKSELEKDEWIGRSWSAPKLNILFSFSDYTGYTLTIQIPKER